jgi:hypothetical protein
MDVGHFLVGRVCQCWLVLEIWGGSLWFLLVCGWIRFPFWCVAKCNLDCPPHPPNVRTSDKGDLADKCVGGLSVRASTRGQGVEFAIGVC